MKRSPVRVRLEAQSKNQDFQNFTKAYQSISLFSFANITNFFALFSYICFTKRAMATFKICVFEHQQREDGRFPISIRITNNRKSVYLKTGMYATRSQISKDFSTVKDRPIARSIDRKIQEYKEVIIQKFGTTIRNYSARALVDFWHAKRLMTLLVTSPICKQAYTINLKGRKP